MQHATAALLEKPEIEAAQEQPALSQADSTAQRRKILFIEDDVDFNLAIARGLNHSGYDVYSCFDGEGGLEKGKLRKPDLVLLDLRLPKVSGWSILRKMKRIAEIAQVPVIVITGSPEYGLEDEASKGLVKRVLRKPVASRQVIQTVNEILGNANEGGNSILSMPDSDEIS